MDCPNQSRLRLEQRIDRSRRTALSPPVPGSDGEARPGWQADYVWFSGLTLQGVEVQPGADGGGGGLNASGSSAGAGAGAGAESCSGHSPLSATFTL